jgi:EAL domain-containing protein (putative c-di-GMP-specific phosphodiesterase class I)/CheY-like chemotaxis protein
MMPLDGPEPRRYAKRYELRRQESLVLANEAKIRACRIVILEDNPLVGQTIQMMIEDHDLGECRLLSEPEPFFDALREWQPTHAILDLAMPGMDGVQVIRELPERAPHIRLILLSGLGQRVIDSACLYAREHGLQVDGALEKPVSAARLRQVICSEAIAKQTPLQRPGPQTPVEAEISVADIRQALHLGEIEPFYQPKIDCATGMLAGFEVLARWRHPGHGVLLPACFIEKLEAGGLMDELTEVIAEQALHWFSGHFGYGFGLSLSLNISRGSLRTQEPLDRLAVRCRELNLDPRRIVLEITESGVMQEPMEAIGLFTRARAQGFELSIDDFGSGYSSMVELVRLPFSELKIDKAIVASAAKSREAELVLSAIIDLASNLRMRATAEGVEDWVTFELLARMGCSCAQGFLFSEGLPASEVSDWVRRWEQVSFFR